MSAEQAQEASPAKQERFHFGPCIGAVGMFLAVVLLVKESSPREVVSSCVLFLVGAELMLPRAERSGRAVRVVRTVLVAVAVALVVVSIAVL